MRPERRRWTSLAPGAVPSAMGSNLTIQTILTIDGVCRRFSTLDQFLKGQYIILQCNVFMFGASYEDDLFPGGANCAVPPISFSAQAAVTVTPVGAGGVPL